ncbi:MAG: DNA mismatch repair protein MutS [Thermodesulfobacteriota bacterium]|nr:DNA mismatch repair protein MutS [Thermodesulfobacteriota bacterium]
MTPMIKQYLEIKNKVPEAILFFRLGDFYEMFLEDAKKASRILDITLTGRDAGKGNRVPMCGVPYHSSKSYINRLVKEGHKVAICEQVEDPKKCKGIVKREIIRIVTPGTNLESEDVDFVRNQYISSFCHNKHKFGFAYVDVGTGIFKVSELESEEKLLDEMCRIEPKELIHPFGLERFKKISHYLALHKEILLKGYEDFFFAREDGEKKLKEVFKIKSIKGLGLADFPAATCAAGAIIHFLNENLLHSLEHIKQPSYYSTSKYMILDHRTQQNLELVSPLNGGSKKSTLLGILNQTLTPMGARLLMDWIRQPLLSPEKIKKRHEAVEALLKEEESLDRIREHLNKIPDIERILSRINCGNTSARDLLAIKEVLSITPQIKKIINSFNDPLVRKIGDGILDLGKLYESLDKAIIENPPLGIKEGGIIKSGYNNELDGLREISSSARSLINRLQEKERDRTGIKSLKIKYNRVFGYYIEITKANLSQVPDYFIRKQTLSNVERFTFPELKEYEEKILGAEEGSHQLEYEIFEEIRKLLLNFIIEIQKIAESIAYLDVLGCFAILAVKNNYTKPEIHQGAQIIIEGGRHPIVEKMLPAGEFVENYTYLDRKENRLQIITGPNMSGKSTYLRQVALIVLMAQIGSFVPSNKARIGIVDRIFTRVGASDNLARGESTFMTEMVETANILNNATPKSFIILDELGRGTSTYDGLSIAWAVCEFLQDIKGACPRTLMATHYHELTQLEGLLQGIKNYCISIKEYEDEIVFLRKVIPGVSFRSYGIHVGRLAGIPEDVLKRAEEILFSLEEEKLAMKKTAENFSKKQNKNIIQELPLFKNNTGKKPVTTPFDLMHLVSNDTKGNEIVCEIQNLKLDNITPKDALSLLYRYQQSLNTKKEKDYLINENKFL